jgi:hypothetical protein
LLANTDVARAAEAISAPIRTASSAISRKNPGASGGNRRTKVRAPPCARTPSAGRIDAGTVHLRRRKDAGRHQTDLKRECDESAMSARWQAITIVERASAV